MYKVDEMVHLKKYEVLSSPGDYILVKGYLACKTAKQLVYFPQQGDEIIDCAKFGEYSLHYEAKTAATLVKIPQDRSFVMLERRDELKGKLIEALIKRVQFFSIPTKERLYVLLYQLGNEIGVQSGNDCYIPTVLTQKELGDYISCSREYLCVVRRRLIEEGWIDKGKNWVLLDWQRWKRHEENMNDTSE
ncbi:Crp/Fnr family transcriptional regulator [Listeria weihenstephanensis]|uniref:Crp/Fnr family transcriptional regulator n=1 Tax=Listeria weihenstephanensis TaxID=1006155 RepID=A0A841Z3C3_9LIST|nr:Crp/Fnr family transcriptional regulator [Listeria weihenstephanensis]MBC1499780.1 Crp/Fnr family transcriptional regulator [Listeria weihenstephanensis]